MRLHSIWEWLCARRRFDNVQRMHISVIAIEPDCIPSGLMIAHIMSRYTHKHTYTKTLLNLLQCQMNRILITRPTAINVVIWVLCWTLRTAFATRVDYIVFRNITQKAKLINRASQQAHTNRIYCFVWCCICVSSTHCGTLAWSSRKIIQTGTIWESVGWNVEMCKCIRSEGINTSFSHIGFHNITILDEYTSIRYLQCAIRKIQNLSFDNTIYVLLALA